jgi:hypothetical protein
LGEFGRAGKHTARASRGAGQQHAGRKINGGEGSLRRTAHKHAFKMERGKRAVEPLVEMFIHGRDLPRVNMYIDQSLWEAKRARALCPPVQFLGRAADAFISEF